MSVKNPIEVPSCIIAWHVTKNGHIWIDGTMGGGVETTDSGRYYTVKTLNNALRHYAKRKERYEREYLKAR